MILSTSGTNAPNLNPKRMWDGSEWFWKILQGEKLIRHIRQAWKTNVQIRFRIRKKNSSIAISALINMGCLEKKFRYKEYHKYIVNIIWTNNAVAFFNGWVNGVIIYFIHVHKKESCLKSMIFLRSEFILCSTSLYVLWLQKN